MLTHHGTNAVAQATVKLASMTAAATLAQIGDDLGGAIGEIAKFTGIGGAAAIALFILTRAYRERSGVQNETIADLRKENRRLRDLLKDKDTP